MRKGIIAVLVSTLLAGPLASIASADPDPIRQAFCAIQRILGYENVQDCNFH
ncbi:MAG: hypothetical protein ACRDH6_01615 [Actinomycetota bacterium]